MENSLRVEELRQAGLSKVRQNRLEESLEDFDQALALAGDPEIGELIRINKAGALIWLQREGPEVQALASVIMKRSNNRHVLLAAYNLANKFRLQSDAKRAGFYLNISLSAANDSGDAIWKPEILIALGAVAILDSRIDNAIEHYEEALALFGDPTGHELSIAFANQSLGYSLLMKGRFADGISLIHQAVDEMKQAGGQAFLAESYIDLCFGYLETEDLEQARVFGEMGLQIATEVRQVRNGHYLLGEVAYKSGDLESAQTHFSKLGQFYPDFPHIVDFLLAIDLRSMVNLKL